MGRQSRTRWSARRTLEQTRPRKRPAPRLWRPSQSRKSRQATRRPLQRRRRPLYLLRVAERAGGGRCPHSCSRRGHCGTTASCVAAPRRRAQSGPPQSRAHARRQGTELVTRLRVSFSAAYARRIDSAVTVGGYRREKEQLAADESSLEEGAARLEGVKADIKAGRATMDARAKAMRADEEALKRAKADLERRKGRFDASAEANEVHADQAATEAEDAKQEELFQQLLNIVRYQ